MSTIRPEDVQTDLRHMLQEVVAHLQRELLEASARLQVEVRQELQHQRSSLNDLIDNHGASANDAPRRTRRTRHSQHHHNTEDVSSSDSDEEQDLLGPISADSGVTKRVRLGGEHQSEGEATPQTTKDSHTICQCGNIFMVDAIYCRKCGSRRQEDGPQASDQFRKKHQTLAKLVGHRLMKKKRQHHTTNHGDQKGCNSSTPYAVPHWRPGKSMVASANEHYTTSAVASPTAGSSNHGPPLALTSLEAEETAGAASATPTATARGSVAGHALAVLPGSCPMPQGGVPVTAQPGPDMAGGVQSNKRSLQEAPLLIDPGSLEFKGPDDGAGNDPNSVVGESVNMRAHVSELPSEPVGPPPQPACRTSHKVGSAWKSQHQRPSQPSGDASTKEFCQVAPLENNVTTENFVVKESTAYLNRSSISKIAKGMWEVATGQLAPRYLVARVVASSFFDYFTTSFVMLNAVSIGFQTDWEVRHIGEEVPPLFKHVELVFCVVFTTELLMRIYVQRCQFFKLIAGWKWNAFDSIVVTMQIMDIVSGILVRGGEDTDNMAEKFSFMRILRILRLVRIIRVVRILRFIRELRMMVCSIANSLRSLMWTVILIFLMIYVVGVYLTQLVSDHGRYNPEKVVGDTPLHERYGSLMVSILSLFQAMTGGVDWEDLSAPLMNNISPLLGVVFTLYIAFAILAMMNVVTAVFIESALLRAREDKESDMAFHMRNVMRRVDTDCSGRISWESFEFLMSDAKMRNYFKALELDVQEAKGLFNLLDTDGSGKISAEEFVSCCLQLRGPAKAIDVATLLYHNRRMSCRWKVHSRNVEAALDEVLDLLYSSQSLPRLSKCGQQSTNRGSRLSVQSTWATWEEIKNQQGREGRELS